MEIEGLVGSASALAIGLTGLGCALAQGRTVASALDGTARNPGSSGTIRGTMILGLGMIDSCLVLVLVFLLSKM
jgi:F-type H+-transporting ATPase subunit c